MKEELKACPFCGIGWKIIAYIVEQLEKMLNIGLIKYLWVNIDNLLKEIEGGK